MKNNNQNFSVSDVVVSPSHNEIESKGKVIRLQPQVMAVFYYLALHRERVIGNEELIENVWRGRVVTHSSVQKSINYLRKALVELIGENQLIAHYSKQGYQLQGVPVFFDAETKSDGDSGWLKFLPWPVNSYLVLALSIIFTASLGFIGIYFFKESETVEIAKTHRFVFNSSRGFTNETGRERGAEPHPDNVHVAYIKEAVSARDEGKNVSRLMVRDDVGHDWEFASTIDSWMALAWSPSGTNIVAVESIHQNSVPITRDFYSSADSLYNIHVFALDLASERLVEKHRLSQWQGNIKSVTWWDDDTIELVGKQGASAVNYRYRYSLGSQRLNVLETLEFAPNPLLSRIHDKVTALASYSNGKTRVDFLNEQQQRISRWPLDTPRVDMSWIPDGSGVFIHDIDGNKLLLLYLDGQRVSIPLPFNQDKILSQPRFSADGQIVYHAVQNPQTSLWLASLNGEKKQVTDNSHLNYLARFSPDGKKIAYVSVRNNQHQIWLIEGNQERQLTQVPLEEKIHTLMWTQEGTALVYSSNNRVYLQAMDEGLGELLVEGFESGVANSFFGGFESAFLNEGQNIIPLAFKTSSDELLISAVKAEARNILHVDVKTKVQKQLTYGSLGAAFEDGGQVYFQYSNQQGLWVLSTSKDKPSLLTKNFPKNSKILSIENNRVYYLTGGYCRESDVLVFDVMSDTHSVYMARQRSELVTHAFSPQVGALFTECLLGESDIVMLH